MAQKEQPVECPRSPDGEHDYKHVATQQAADVSFYVCRHCGENLHIDAAGKQQEGEEMTDAEMMAALKDAQDKLVQVQTALGYRKIELPDGPWTAKGTRNHMLLAEAWDCLEEAEHKVRRAMRRLQHITEED